MTFILSPLLTGGEEFQLGTRRDGPKPDKRSGPASAHSAKVMNRFDLTKRLVGQLKREEAVVGGIGNANFDLWASGQSAQNFT